LNCWAFFTFFTFFDKVRLASIILFKPALHIQNFHFRETSKSFQQFRRQIGMKHAQTLDLKRANFSEQLKEPRYTNCELPRYLSSDSKQY